MKFVYILKNLRFFDTFNLMPIMIFTFFFSYFFLDIKFSSYTFLRVVILMFIFLFYALSINNYYDWKNDAKNKRKIKKNPIASKKLTRTEGLVMSKLLLMTGIFLSVLWFPNMLVWYVLITLNVFLYSYKFKSIPILDLMSHGFYLYSLFLFPAILLGFSSFVILAAFLLIFFLSTVAQLENEIEDYKSDKKSGVETTAVRFGLNSMKKLHYISNLVLILSLIGLFFILNNILLLVFLPLIMMSMFRLDNKFIKNNFEKISLLYISLSILILLTMLF